MFSVRIVFDEEVSCAEILADEVGNTNYSAEKDEDSGIQKIIG